MVADGLARRLLIGLVMVEAGLAVLHAGVTLPGTPPELLDFGSLKYETSLGTWFSSLQFAALAAVLFALWRREGGMWLLLAVGALFLSADEAASIHERLGSLVKHAVSRGVPGTFTGWLRLEYRSYYWLLLYLPLAVPAALVVARFLWVRLESHRRAVVWGIAIFFVGAAGLDFLEGLVGNDDHGPLPFGPVLVDVILLEEVLEMLGVSLVLAAVAEHAARRFAGFREGDTPPPCRSAPFSPGKESG